MANGTQSHEERRSAYAKAIAQAWSDEAFKAKLKSDPSSVLAELGAEVPAGVTVKVVENTADTYYLVVPIAPEEELSEEDLVKVSGGPYSPDFYPPT